MGHGICGSTRTALVLAFALAAAGCGGGSGGNSDNDDTGPAAEAIDDRGFDHRGTPDDPTRLQGPLNPARNLSTLLVEDLVVGELLPAMSPDTGDAQRIASASRCLAGSLDMLLGAPEAAIMTILDDLDNGREPDREAATASAGARLDNGVNRLADSLLLALGGSGHCGEGVELEPALPGQAINDLLALARSGAFILAAEDAELQELLEELSPLTGEVAEELAGNPGIHPLYHAGLRVMQTTVTDIRAAFGAALAPSPDLLSVEQSAGRLVENLLHGLVTDMLSLATLAAEGRVDGGAYTEMENLLTGHGDSLTGGTPGSARTTLEASMATLMEELLAEGAEILADPPEDGRLLTALQVTDNGPLTRLLKQLLTVARGDGTPFTAGS